MFAALKDRDYRLLFTGQAVSYIGDQFHLVALPWLVLSLTHDPLQLGLVLAASGIPRAALMLVGGAWADRFSPRKIMLVSDTLRALVTLALVVAIASAHVQLWMVYALAIAFGIVSGFFMPAAEAAVPRLLPDTALESGNSLIMGADQIATFVGPTIAGTLIAWLGGAQHAGAASLLPLAIAFGVDAASFVVSAATLVLMHPIPALLSGDTHPLADVAEGIRFVIGHPMLRMLVTVVALANLFVTGPLLVGIPVLAATRYTEGAAAFGIIVSAFGFGNIGGMVAAGALPRLPDRAVALLSVALFVVFAGVYTALGFVGSMWIAAAMMIVTGLGNGYLAILVMTALQRLAPEHMLGRVMSLMMLAMVGLAPISQSLAGAVLKLSVPAMFAAAGVGMLATGVFVFTQRHVWVFPEAAEPEAEAAENPSLGGPELDAA